MDEDLKYKTFAQTKRRKGNKNFIAIGGQYPTLRVGDKSFSSRNCGTIDAAIRFAEAHDWAVNGVRLKDTDGDPLAIVRALQSTLRRILPNVDSELRNQLNEFISIQTIELIGLDDKIPKREFNKRTRDRLEFISTWRQLLSIPETQLVGEPCSYKHHNFGEKSMTILKTAVFKKFPALEGQWPTI
jgi:hypothetical protein